MAPTNAKRRRQDDQSSITRYFGATTLSAGDDDGGGNKLPKQVQSSLLSVGARVRKAMAGAQFTRLDGDPSKSHAAVQLPLQKDSIALPSSHSLEEEAVKHTNNNFATTATILPSVPYASVRPELFPFCGSYKTGDIDPKSYNYSPGVSRTLKRSHSQTVAPVPFDSQDSSDSEDREEEDLCIPGTSVFATQTPPLLSEGAAPGFVEGDFEEAPFLKSKEEADLS
ncbi:hypothetical protein KEM54_004916 [Ascosphaera aggregata]|nr:hypothetical protein KEM54_004916 [Ascosphaera aggregata]